MSGEAFAVERLREDPDLDYAAMRRVAEDAGVTMQPIQYGRARKQLGLPPLAPARPEPEVAAPPQEDVAVAAEADGADDTDSDVAADDDVATDDTDAADDDVGASADNEPAAPAADIVAPRRKGSAAFDYVVQELRRDGAIVYGDLRASAEARGFKIAPIMYGRAKAMLGLVPVKARGQGKKAATAVPEAPRVLKQVESVAADRFSKRLEEVRSLEQLVGIVKDLDAQRRKLRGVLERIVAMIDEALA